jgi:nucleoside-diphosphate-sugar epimerase
VKLLVSGASGFLGKYVLPFLHNRNDEVFLIVRDQKHAKNLAKDYPKFTIILYDYTKNLRFSVGEKNFDVYLNLAWGELNNFHSSWHLNNELPAQKRMLADVILLGVKKVVSIGTCLEYSNLVGEIRESDQCEPVIPYAVAKNEFRKFIEKTCNSNEIKYSWIRLFYFYGHGQQPRTLFGQIQAAVNSDQDTFIGSTNGMQSLDYMHVNEVAAKLVELVYLGDAFGQINLCGGFPRTLREIVQSWIAEESWKIQIVWGEDLPRAYEQNAFWGSTKKLDQIISLNQGS